MEPKIFIQKMLKTLIYTLFILFLINTAAFLLDAGSLLIGGGSIYSFEYSNFQFMLNDRLGYNQFASEHTFINIVIFLLVTAYVSRRGSAGKRPVEM